MAETRAELTNYSSTGAADDPQRIEQEIALTRREMAGTLDSIQRRLEPERLKNEAKRKVEEAVEQAKDKVENATIGRVNDMTHRVTRKAANWRTNMINTIKENPVPAALVGVGLGWLIMESAGNGDDYDQRYGNRYDDYSYGGYGYGDYTQDDMRYSSRYAQPYYGDHDMEEQGMGDRLQSVRRDVGRRVEETTGELRDRAEHLRDEAAERLEETTGEIRHRAEHLREEAGQLREDVGEQWDEFRDEAAVRAREMRYAARRQTRQVKRSLQTMMEENPLAIGAAAIALGVLVGWAAPSTEAENRLMGEYRDDLVDQARSEAETIANRAQSAAREAVQDVTQEAKSAAKKAADEVTDESKRAAQRVSNDT